MEVANEEASQKDWCDIDLYMNEQVRKEKTVAVETMTAEIDQLQASLAKLSALTIKDPGHESMA